MKRKPCVKVPLPVSPRATRSHTTNCDRNKSKIDLTEAVITENESQEENIELKTKSPFYKKAIEHQREKTKVVKKMKYNGSDVKGSGTPEQILDNMDPVDAERSGVSLNSSYLTLSTANSSMSQDSSDISSQERSCNSQSSKDQFTITRSSDDADQLDYDDTLTSGERTPNAPEFSPLNSSLRKPGKNKSDCTSESSKSTPSSPAIEVVIDRDMVEYIDYEAFVKNRETENPQQQKPFSVLVNVENKTPSNVNDENKEKSKDGNTDRAAGGNKNVEIVDLNNNIGGPQDLVSDQEVMAKTYQVETDKTESLSNEASGKKGNIGEVNRHQVTDQEVMSNTYDSFEGLKRTGKESQRGVMVSSGSDRPMMFNNGTQTPLVSVPNVSKETVVNNQTSYSAVMPRDLEPRQLMQMRQEAACPLSPITEENLAVERVAKELVNTYGGKNSDRIPEMFRDHARLGDYDFGTGLGFQQSRETRHYQHQQVSHNTDYHMNKNDLPRDPQVLHGALGNGGPFGDPQGSSTPDIYQGKPICFSPDDFPSPYGSFDVPVSNQQWPGTNGYSNSCPQNLRQPDYFLPENPLSTPTHASTLQQKSGYRGKGIIDLQGGGDYRPYPQSHDNTTMTFTPRALMESHLSSSYFASNSQNSSMSKQGGLHSDSSSHSKHPLNNMDCSSIYPSRDFIEKSSRSNYKPDAPARVPSYEALVPPPKKRKLRSLSETELSADKPDFIGYHLGLPPIENRFGPPRHKYYVVNPSETESMPPKTLISKYIDFLIVENEQITEISKSVSQPVDIYVTEDMYFMDNLKCKAPFPSKKFVEWVSSFYPKIRLDKMRFPGMGRRPGERAGEDRRPTQQVLEDIFYFFQRQVMNLEG